MANRGAITMRPDTGTTLTPTAGLAGVFTDGEACVGLTVLSHRLGFRNERGDAG